MAAVRQYAFDDYLLDAESRLLFRHGKRVAAAPKVIDLLITLVEAQGQVLGKRELFDRVWPGAVVEDGSLTSHISLLRRTLQRTGRGGTFIETIPKRGYRFVAAVARPQAASARARSPTDRRLLIVLPFQSLDTDSKHDYFSDGLTEEMIAQLARLNPRRLGVIARTSAMQYRDTTKTIEQIALELGVTHLLEGSVRRAGNRVRITAQLIHATDQALLWSDSLERNLRDILRVQSDIARTIAKQIGIQLDPRVRAQLSARVDPRGYESYLRGRDLLNRRTPQALRQATRMFRLAIAREPQSARAWSALADCYIVPGTWSWIAPRVVAVSAEAAARKALACDDTLAEAHVSLAMVLSLYARRFDDGEAAFRRAIELNPNYTTAHHWFSFLLSATGRTASALAEIRLAHELDPLSQIVLANWGTALFWARQYEAAAERCQAALALNPRFWFARWMLGLACEQLGQYAQAIAQQRLAISYLAQPSSLLIASLTRARALGGAKSAAMRRLGQLVSGSRRGAIAWYHAALAHAALGQLDTSFQLLERACEERDPWAAFLEVDPRIDPLRNDGRYTRLLKRVRGSSQ